MVEDDVEVKESSSTSETEYRDDDDDDDAADRVRWDDAGATSNDSHPNAVIRNRRVENNILVVVVL
jgi:hypothetical protein